MDRGKYLMNERIYDTIVKSEPISKGLSDDKKYYVETSDSQRLFLRGSGLSEHDRKKSEYEMMAQVYNYGVSMPKLVEFGLW
jgi:serine/threonine-protein kinase